MTTDNKVVSMAGTPILTYPQGEQAWQVAAEELCLEEISNHIERHIGPIKMVFHEIISDTVHIDVHHVAPSDERPFHTLITSGMSDLPMQVPDGAPSSGYMELMITLPADWQISQEAFEDERWYWPVRELKFLARFPHKFNTWLGWGHTIPNGDPAEPFADNTALAGVILLPPISTPEAFWELPIDASKSIQFFSIVPLFKEEIDLKLHKGSDALLDRFDRHNIGEVIDIGRKNVARKRFGLF